VELKDKVAIITGAGSGIGRATALRLAREGAAIVVADLDDAGAAETVRQIEAEGGRAGAVHTDVTHPADIDGMFVFADKTYGGFDVLYNNAGITTGQPRWPDCTDDAWHRTIAVDLIAVIDATRKAIPKLTARGGGVIIHTASLAGLFGFQADPVYTAAKHGVVGLTRSLVNLKDEANIRVNCVCPGVVRTPLVTRGLDALTGAAREEAERRIGSMPMIDPAEVADAVYELIANGDATGIALGVTIGQRRVVDPPITLPTWSGDPNATPAR
jgi:NAD(P)-dependent dehydrogenase (short-subunit alcohol dehydrogenase family)